MRAIHLLTGCVLALAFAATAHAATHADAGSASADDCAHSCDNSSATRDTAISAGDNAGLAHIAAPSPQADSSAHTSRASGDSAISGSGGSDDASPPHSHAVSLGWQSLLPGSIQ